MAIVEQVPIPEPRRLPFIGNIAEFDPEHPLQTLHRLSDTYGEIFRLHFPGGKSVVFVTTRALVNELCDETRFQKTLNSILGEVRAVVHDGLFTAKSDEPNWGVAHRILMPAFGPVSIRGMFDDMYDIATQMAMKWARHGSSTPIPVSSDFTRLTLDTLALCSMNFRFNSFYREEMHPFISAMADVLTECGKRNRRPGFAGFLYRSAEQKFHSDIELMRKTADDVLQSRRQTPTEGRDLLSAMLNGIDPRTGQKLGDSSITDNLITFLIAGHETTSGTLSFAFYELLKNPFAYEKAQAEVDSVIGRSAITVEHLSKLPYLAAVLRETLRLCSPIPAFGVEPKEDGTLLAGKYAVKKGEPVVMFLAKAHLDPRVYGNDAHQFKPERMLDESFESLQREFPNCWKPFGNGMRACLGRPFAWQEALLAAAMMLQNFNFQMADPNYRLNISETLTIKPKGFYMYASLRHGMSPGELERRLAGRWTSEVDTNSVSSPDKTCRTPTHTDISVFYGSNSGTCEALAHRLAQDAVSHGFRASSLGALDMAREALPTTHPVVLITSSYEGQPPDNAAQFCAWIESLKGAQLSGVSFAVFGCGHHDWAQTFHRIPKLVDSCLSHRGATRLAPLGLTDAAERDIFSDFETWEDSTLWPALTQKYNNFGARQTSTHHQVGLSVKVSTPRSSYLRQDVREARVLEAKTLTSQTALSRKTHIEIQLPTGMTYRAGDYLAVLPFNPPQNVERVFRKFQLSWDAHLAISGNTNAPLPLDQDVSAYDIFRAYVELGQPATRRDIHILAQYTSDDNTVKQLERLAGTSHEDHVKQKRTILDLLEEFCSVQLPVGTFLGLLPPMRIRQYSISSSPLHNPTSVTLTYSLLDLPSFSGHGRHLGVATHYLDSLTREARLHVAVRSSHEAFHLPNDVENTPIICICAGSGIAPFRGFIQERAAMLEAGRRNIAPALLFYGCRSPAEDDLYREEFDAWERVGAVSVRRAYSRATNLSEGCRYVQDRVFLDKKDVYELWQQGAKLFVCGSRAMGKGVEDIFVKLVMEHDFYSCCALDDVDDGDLEEEKVRRWLETVRNVRYATDVFD